MASLIALGLLVAACGGGGGGAEDPPPVGGGNEQPQDNGNSTGPTPQEGPDALYFRPGTALAAAGALDKVSGGDALFAVWNPQDQQAALKPGLKIMFFGTAQGCQAGVQGPLAPVSDDRLADVARLTGMAHAAAAPALRWTPAGGSAGCSNEAQARSGASAVYLNADDTAGGVGMLTTSGKQDDSGVPFFGPYGRGGQNGAGTNAHIGGTFVNFRQAWSVADPLQPWIGGAVARVRSVQSMGAAQVDTAGEAVQAKQQMMATFLNPTCLRENSGQPCQIQYLFNTAIVRSGVTDWSKVSWFQQGDVWFDPVQGGIPIVDGPIRASGAVTTDSKTGLPLFTSQGSATQHGSFSGRTFDVTISFEQLQHVLRIVAGRKLSVDSGSVSDTQVAAVWGRAWNDRNAWVLLTGHVGQEVYNPSSEHKVQIGGGFRSLYVGPQG
ncbi:MAG: hypothetical protein ACOZJX_14020 [Pseudomonadota bacterium]